MLPDPDLLSVHALADSRIAVSVSDSADLERLGLHPKHLDLAVGEIGRAVILAGGHIVYGGRLQQPGFTAVLAREVRKYGDADHCLTLCVPLSEHIALTAEEIQEVEEELGTSGRLETLDLEGSARPWTDYERPSRPLAPDAGGGSLRAMRQHMSESSDARIVVGGRLANHAGPVPGVLEEILLSLRAGKPVYLAGGFGGAAAAAAQRVTPGHFEWLPAGIPAGSDLPAASAALDEIEELVHGAASDLVSPGLTPRQQAVLAATHRPGEIASLTALGLSRALADLGQRW